MTADLQQRSFGEYLVAQVWRLCVGVAFGSILAVLWRLLVEDALFRTFVRRQWYSATLRNRINGIEFYESELLWLAISLSIVAALSVWPITLRLFRAWWAGIVSLLIPVVALLTALTLRRDLTGIRSVLAVVNLIVLLSLEYLQQSDTPLRSRTSNLRLNIPTTRPPQSAAHWDASVGDDPILGWDQDLFGREAIVEVLALHALELGTPVIALQGALGDGKTSVLNLLRRSIGGKAIVVSFSAWLPGSEETFARDLFRDVATESTKRYYVPHLRRRANAYAKILSGSVSFLAGLKDLLPTITQRDEIEELRQALRRIPTPIVVLLDEIDRMQHEEILVLLKVLRGAASIPNVTFICAFSEAHLQTELRAGGGAVRTSDYLEKFFPVTIRLSPPTVERVSALVRFRLSGIFEKQGWFKSDQTKAKFDEALSKIWGDALASVCTNLRKATLLLNEISNAGLFVKGEVDPLDFIAIQTLRRFAPDIHRLVESNPVFFTFGTNSWLKGGIVINERKKREGEAFFVSVKLRVDDSAAAAAMDALLIWMFPDYSEYRRRTGAVYFLERPVDVDSAEEERRICHSDYFPIYFRGAVPEDMASQSEVSRFVRAVAQLEGNEPEILHLFTTALQGMRSGDPKRVDFLWKVGRAVRDLDDSSAVALAFAAATDADIYAYDMINVGEAARALNIVFEAAQVVSSSKEVQRVLEGSMERSADDTFARRLLEYTENPKRNQILVNMSNVDFGALKRAFTSRMRRRYNTESAASVSLIQGDWWAFQQWANNSEEDQRLQQEFWRAFIGGSRKRLAQVINFCYPGNVAWENDPRVAVGKMLPLKEIGELQQNLPDGEELSDVEQTAFTRFNDLLAGKWGLLMEFSN